MPPIDQDRQLNTRGSPERADRVHRGPAGSSRKKHVIDEYDSPPLEMQRETRLIDIRQAGAQAKIVPMHRDIDNASLRADAFDLPKLIGQTLGERRSSEGDACKHELSRRGIVFKNLMRDPPQRARNRFFIQD
jgi:hypothetical protein